MSVSVAAGPRNHSLIFDLARQTTPDYA